MFVGRRADTLRHISRIQCMRTEGTESDSSLLRHEHILSVSCCLHHSFLTSPFPSLSSGLFEGVAGLWPLHQVDSVVHWRLRGHDAGGAQLWVRRRGHARSESQRHHFCRHPGYRVWAPGRRGGSSEEGGDVLPRGRLGPRQCQWVGRHRYWTETVKRSLRHFELFLLFSLISSEKGSYDTINRMLSDELNTVVVSVE